MKEKIVSTTYAALQPPYQILSYGEILGVQIGTLIVTTQLDEDNENDYSIKTHSHPVVAYGNKEMHLSNNKLYEGTVWDKVELHDVRTICMSNEHDIDWQRFCLLMKDSCQEYISKNIIHAPQTQFYWSLRKLGITVNRPRPGNYKIHLHIEEPFGNGGSKIICSSPDDILFVFSWLKKDDGNMLFGQLQSYNFIMRNGNRHIGFIHLEFESNDQELQDTINKINNNSELTDIPLFI